MQFVPISRFMSVHKAARNTWAAFRKRPMRTSCRLLVRYYPLVIIFSLPILILGPLLARGYILHYDMVFAPHVHINLNVIRDGTTIWQQLPLTLLLKASSWLLPMDVVQKLILSALLIVPALALYLSTPVTSRAARLIGGLVYTLNPFTYDRFMAGHWRFLAGYAITPFVLRAFLSALSKISRRTIVIAIALWSISGYLSLHHLFIHGLLFAALAIVFVRSKKQMLVALAVPSAVLITHLWWIIPTLLSNNVSQSISVDHFVGFASKGDSSVGIWFNLLSLHGFWYEGWRTVKDYFGFWAIIFTIWLIPALAGVAYAASRHSKICRLIAALCIASTIAIILAAGPHPSVSALNRWLFSELPGMNSMRESQKFIALLSLFYAVLTVHGLQVLSRLKRKQYAVVVLCVFAVLIAYARPMWRGFDGQLKTVDYPRAWYRFGELLERDTDGGNVLVLPWELYVDKTVTDDIVAQPARVFFGDRVIQSHAMRMPGVTDWEPAEYRAIDNATKSRDMPALRKLLESLEIEYIIITQTKRADGYRWLFTQRDLNLLINDQELLVLQLTKR